jgi:hypothetical protein
VTTTLKIVGKPTSGAAEALERHVADLYARPGAHILAVMELRHVERLQPAPGSDKTASVGMKIVGCEVPTVEQEGAIREVQRALYLQRTARGTLDEDGQIVLTDDTLKYAAGLVTAIEVARLRAGLEHWVTYARQVVNASSKLAATEIAHEVQTVADGLAAVLAQANPED